MVITFYTQLECFWILLTNFDGYKKWLMHSGPDPLETILVKIENSLKNLQNASKRYITLECWEGMSNGRAFLVSIKID